MKDTFIVDEHDGVVLLGAEVMKDRREASAKRSGKRGSGSSVYKGPEYTDEELKRYAMMTINDRITFCKEKKDKIGVGEDIDRCICESIARWIRLFKDSKMKGSKELGRLRISAVEKLFEEMKKDGRIKCPEKV